MNMHVLSAYLNYQAWIFWPKKGPFHAASSLLLIYTWWHPLDWASKRKNRNKAQPHLKTRAYLNQTGYSKHKPWIWVLKHWCTKTSCAWLTRLLVCILNFKSTKSGSCIKFPFKLDCVINNLVTSYEKHDEQIFLICLNTTLTNLS